MLRTIIFIPNWIINTLRSRKISTNELGNLKLMMQYLSVDDIVSLVVLNNYFRDLLGFRVNKEIGKDIISLWRNGDPEVDNFIDQTIIPNLELYNLDDILSRLVDDSKEVEETELKAIDLNSEASAIVLDEGYFTSHNTNEIQYQLIDNILQVLYVYHPHHTVAKSTIGGKYLELLELFQ